MIETIREEKPIAVISGELVARLVDFSVEQEVLVDNSREIFGQMSINSYIDVSTSFSSLHVAFGENLYVFDNVWIESMEQTISSGDHLMTDIDFNAVSMSVNERV